MLQTAASWSCPSRIWSTTRSSSTETLSRPTIPLPESERVSHDVEGPSDVTAVLELFDRRYREARGEEYPDSTEQPA